MPNFSTLPPGRKPAQGSLSSDQLEALHLLINQPGWVVLVEQVAQLFNSAQVLLEQSDSPSDIYRMQGRLAALRDVINLPGDLLGRKTQ